MRCSGIGTNLAPSLGATSVLAVHRKDIWSAKEGGVPDDVLSRREVGCGLCVQLCSLLNPCICSCSGKTKMTIGEPLIGVDAGPEKQTITAFPSPEACGPFLGLRGSLCECDMGSVYEAEAFGNAVLTHNITLELFARFASRRPMYNLWKKCGGGQGRSIASHSCKTFCKMSWSAIPTFQRPRTHWKC